MYIIRFKKEEHIDPPTMKLRHCKRRLFIALHGKVLPRWRRCRAFGVRTDKLGQCLDIIHRGS